MPHNVPLVLLGTGLLWFGWMGFNAGSALAAGQTAAYALLNTNTAAAAALLTWLVWDQVRGGTPTAIGAATGAVVGLVAITPACGFVMPGGALLIGAVASTVSWFLVANKHRLLPNDALDFFACNSTAGTGLVAGHAAQVGKQLIGVLAVAALAGAGTFVLLKLTALITPLRLTQQQEVRGVDLSEHQRTSGGGVPGGAESAGRPGVRRQRLTRPPTRLPAL